MALCESRRDCNSWRAAASHSLAIELVASMLLDQRQTIPQGLKPRFYAVLAARLKPCPFKTRFMQPVLGACRVSFRCNSQDCSAQTPLWPEGVRIGAVAGWGWGCFESEVRTGHIPDILDRGREHWFRESPRDRGRGHSMGRFGPLLDAGQSRQAHDFSCGSAAPVGGIRQTATTLPAPQGKPGRRPRS